MWIPILIILAYLAGSLPTSIIAGKLLRGIDIREYGSRNPGATNTFRVLGKKIGIGVGLIDIFKGFFAVRILTPLLFSPGYVSLETAMMLSGAAAICGHVWTVFAGFRGGKGVGAAFGVFLGLAPLPSLIVLAVWLALTFGTGYVSVGSIAAAAVLPFAVAIMGIVRGNFSLPLTILSAILGILVIIRHKANIKRLLKGEELRFGKRGSK